MIYHSSLIVIGPIFSIDKTVPDNHIAVQRPGWHINSDTEHPALAAYRATPATPFRAFEGWPDVATFFYSFDSKQHADSILLATGFAEVETDA